MRQVAAAAGVSVATASRALSDSAAVVDSTKERVRRVALDLDYTPSRVARSLVTGLTGNVGVVVPDVTNPFFALFLAELEADLGAQDIGLLIGNSQEDRAHEQRLVHRMTTQVDGLVLASSRLSDDQIVQTAQRLPVVLANRRIADVGVAHVREVVIDVRPGFEAAVRHLHGLGHRQLAYVDGPMESWSAAQKRDALRRVSDELGLSLILLATDRPDFSGGRAAGPALRDGDATAVLTYNDQVALGVLSALRDAGLDVPGHVSVVGCDDALPVGLAQPSLSTIDSSARALGAIAAAAVLDPSVGGVDTVRTRFVPRKSTGPVRPVDRHRGSLG